MASLVATHARTHDPAKERAALTRQVSGRKPRKREVARPEHPAAPSGDAVTRKVDSAGSISFAAASYRVGSEYRRKQVQVAIVDNHVQIAFEGAVIRTHPIRHDPTRQHGALANPAGRPNRINAA